MGKQNSVLTDLESRLVAVSQRLGEAAERIGSIGLSPADAGVVCRLVADARDRAAEGIHVLHPEFARMDVDDVLEEFTILEVRHWTERQFPKEDPHEDVQFVCALVGLLAHGIGEIAQALDDPVAADEVSFAMSDVISDVCRAMRIIGDERARIRMTLWYTERMTQVIARVPAEVAKALDRLVASGAFASRSDAVREALAQLIDRHRRAEIGCRIVEGYRRVPQTEDEVGWSDAATVAMIEEEPW